MLPNVQWFGILCEEEGEEIINRDCMHFMSHFIN